MKALGLVVLEKKIFLCFSHCKSMGANDPREHYILLQTKYESSGPCGFREEDFFMFYPPPPPPPGRARMDPRVTAGRIYKEDHYTLLHTKYESSGPCGFREEDFFMFYPPPPPRGGPVWTPGSRLAGFIKRTTIHCYTQNMKALGLVVSEIFLYFPHDAPGVGPVWTPGARLAGFMKRTTRHCYTQNMKALGFLVSEKKIFLCFSHCKSMGANDPRGGVILTPGPWLAGFTTKH